MDDMDMDISNLLAKSITKTIWGLFLDSNNVLWKHIDSEWIGKRSVFTFDFRACWLEDTDELNVKYWWCGKESDYSEIFKK